MTGSDSRRTPAAVPPTNLPEIFGSSLVYLQPQNLDDAPTIITPTRGPDAPKSNLRGQRLGHFELIESIGSGGMATVIMARDLDLGRIVALKILPPDTARDSEAVTRFKQEARAAAKLDHENVARVYYCGEDRGLNFIAFEYVEGENLRQRIDREGKIPLVDALRFMHQVTQGLAHASERGVVHRDIKPSNIIITPTGRAKIVDMGLARQCEAHSNGEGVTQSGMTLGTFDYISPEQAMDPRRADVRSDIYSLGCTFYHALTGRPPVPEGTAAKKLHAHQYEMPIDPRDLNPEIPDGMARILARMMAKDLTQRYQTPAELTHDLAVLAKELGIDPLGSSEHSSLASFQLLSTTPGEVNRLPMAMILSVAIVVVVLVVMLGLVGTNPDPNQVPSFVEPFPTSRNASTPELPTPGNTEAPTPSEANPNQLTAANTEALIQALNRTTDSLTIRLKPGEVYDLAKAQKKAMFTGSELIIEALAPSPLTGPTAMPVLVLSAYDDEELDRPGGFFVRDARRVSLRGIDIRIEAQMAVMGPPTDPVGLQFFNVDRIELESCRIRSTLEGRKQKIIGISADFSASTNKTCQLSARYCLFDMGNRSVGMQLTRRVSSDIYESAFGPHAAAIELTDSSVAASGSSGPLRLQSCTFMIDRSCSAFSADRGASASITSSGCVFANPYASNGGDREMMPGAEERLARPVVLRHSEDAQFTAVRFESTSAPANGYYQVDPVAQGTKHYNWEEFGTMTTPNLLEPKPILFSRHPWIQKDPRLMLGPDASDPGSAFLLDIATQRKLHVDGNTRVRVLGASELRGPNQPIYSPWPPVKPQLMVVAKERQRVVYPDAEPDDAKNRIYRTFGEAFSEAQIGETILLASNGKVPVPQALIYRQPRLLLKVMAYPEYNPILVAEARNIYSDSPLFSLSDGSITFEGIGIHVTGYPAVVRLAGSASCTFTSCVITLDGTAELPVTAVVLPEVGKDMRIGMGNDSIDRLDPPRIQWDRTLLRGRGRALWAQAPRAFQLTVTDSAAVLDGSFMVLEPGGKDMSASPRANIKLTQFTSALSGSFLQMRAGRNGMAPPTFPLIEAEKSLFTALENRVERKPMVLIEEGDSSQEPQNYLIWKSLTPNLYWGYNRSGMLELRPPVAEGSAVNWSYDRWRRFSNDAERGSGRIYFENLKLIPLTVKPVDLKATNSDNEKIEVGVDPQSLPENLDTFN